MKNLLPLVFCLPFLAHAQLIHTPTVLPVQPTTGDSIMVIIKTMTPYLGHKLARTATVTKTGTINIDICNFSGMPAAIQYYTDTFEVGQLSAGAWSLVVNYSISTNGGACTSQSVAGHSFTVSAVTMLNEFAQRRPEVYPNPARDVLTVRSPLDGALELRDVSGRTIASVKKTDGAAIIDVSGLATGIYLLCDRDNRIAPSKVMIER